MNQMIHNLSLPLQKHNGDVLNILGMIGIALLTILIPVGIAILSEKNGFEDLDRKVILGKVVNARWFLLLISAIYLPLVFWNFYQEFRLWFLMLWFIGIFFMVMVLVSAYQWLKGSKFEMRFEYLKGLKESEDMEGSWHSVWETKEINTQNETQFFKQYSQAIDNLKDSRPETALKMLQDFNNFIDNRSTFFLIYSEIVLTKILEWDFLLWEKYENCCKRKDSDNIFAFDQISMTLRSMINKIEKKTFGDFKLIFFFNSFKPHIEKYRKKFVEKGVNNRSFYITSIIQEFFSMLVGNIEKIPNKHDFWSNFPNNWKITIKNIQDEENIVSTELLNSFIGWSTSRIVKSELESKYDKALEEVAYGLFQEADPILLSKLFTFAILMGSDEGGIKSIIERGTIFGFVGRVMTGWSEELIDEQFNKQMDMQEKETINIMLFINRNWNWKVFSQEKLKKYIHELESFSYSVETDSEKKKESRRKSYIRIFKKMFSMLESKTQ